MALFFRPQNIIVATTFCFSWFAQVVCGVLINESPLPFLSANFFLQPGGEFCTEKALVVSMILNQISKT